MIINFNFILYVYDRFKFVFFRYVNLCFFWVLKVFCGVYNVVWEFVEDDWFYGYRGILFFIVVFVVYFYI